MRNEIMSMDPMPRRQSSSFHTTRWTRVCLAKADSEDGRRALEELCGAYYEPVLAFLRCQLRDVETARDMAHAFFAKLLEGGGIAGAQRDRGRFRAYLLGAVKHFLAGELKSARALKRGGGMAPVSLDGDGSGVGVVPAGDGLAPDAAFDRQWALTVVAQAMTALKEACVAEGKEAQYEVLKPWLMGDATHGDQAALAESLGMKSSALRMAIQRLRQRFRDCIQAEIAATLEDAAMVKEEMGVLMAALAS